MFSRKWAFRVRHILDAVARIRQYTEGMGLETFHIDSRTVDAVVYNLAIIGEAVRHIPDEVQSTHPGIPWKAMRAMRNVVVHEYERVNVSIVWETLQQDLPPLVPLLEELLRECEGS